MMNLKADKNSVVSLVLVGSLFLLTGCFGDKAQEGKLEGESHASQEVQSSDVLLSIDGKPVLYVDDFEDQKAMAQQSNQQLNMILQMMPDAEYSMLFKSIEAGHLMKEWVVRSGIDQEDDLVKQRRQYHEAIDLQLYMKYYEDAHPIEVTESEAKDYYHAKRDQIPGLIVTPVSIEIVYANFDTKDQAESFASSVKDGSEKHFKAAAKELGVKFERMSVSADTTADELLKNSVLAATKFPSKEIVKNSDNSYSVIGMLKKRDAEYRSFETAEIKKGITDMLKNEKREVELSKQVEKLSKEYNVVENLSYFENKKQNQAKALSMADKIVQQAQQGADELTGDNNDFDIMLDDKI